MEKRRVILKISGEALSGEKGVGIDAKSVKVIAKEIKNLYDTGMVELAIIVGGGNIWRGRDAQDNGMERASADYMGMLGTILNALALQNALEVMGCETRTMTSLTIPSVAEPYIRRKAIGHLEKDIIVIFGGGTGNPFFSTDTTAALRAAEIGAKTILMAKNGVNGVYDKDPRKFPDAKRYEKLTYRDLINQKLEVMDLTAATLCSENHIDILVFDMKVPGNIARAIADDVIGTKITN
jgi:uridylate kinase